MQYKLAVYGTLREGFSNHRLISHCEKVCKGHTEKGLGLAVNGLPYLVRDEAGRGCFVEVYNVDHATLKRCDMLEGHPDWYRRELITVYERPTGHEIKCWCYIYQGETNDRYIDKF